MAVWMIRHGETEWSRAGRHTGSTDLPLTPDGELQAKAIGRLLGGRRFDLVRSSPMRRARETARLAGYGDRLEVVDELREVDYGEYEGLTTAQIWERRPEWELFRDGCPGGETPERISRRVDRIRERVLDGDRHVLLFGHGHALRALAVRYLGLPIGAAAQVRLDAGSLSIMTMERDGATLVLWNRRVPPRALLVADLATNVPDQT